MQYQNPIIKGFNPDPSICRVGEDFYLVTSTFEFFPGVPIYHSRDLVNWLLIGHCLTRESQLPLNGCAASQGIYAPTLRHHDDRFYMTTTNVSGRGNFIVYTDDIRGEWSEPVWIDQGGIDPSLLFEDGTVYYCSNGGVSGEGDGIFLCELDPHTGEKTAPTRKISSGCGGKHPEAPHLYKIGGRYYLMLAEGGTEYGHMVTMLRSDAPYGPFVECPEGPILSHKDKPGPIQCTGHADIVEDMNGNWWMVALGTRPLGRAMLHNLGRETFLAPMTWRDGWPVVAGGKGLELFMDGPLAAAQAAGKMLCADFSAPALDNAFTYIRNPDTARYRVYPGKNCLRLAGGDVGLSHPDLSPTFVGVRQREFDCLCRVLLSAEELSGDGFCGLTAYYNDSYHYDIGVMRRGGNATIALRKRVHDMECVTDSAPAPAGPLWLQVEADRQSYRFSYSQDGERFQPLGEGLTAGLCTEGTHMMTFTGVFLGMFAENANTDFRCFSYEDL